MVTRGGSWPFLHSHRDVVDRLASWRRTCAEYDLDPAEFSWRARQRARAFLAAEAAQEAQAAAEAERRQDTGNGHQ